MAAFGVISPFIMHLMPDILIYSMLSKFLMFVFPEMLSIPQKGYLGNFVSS